MTLLQFLEVLEPGTPFCIEYDTAYYNYREADELYQDFVFYEDIKDKKIVNIWHSQYLYNAITLVIE